MEDAIYCVYVITNLINGKIYFGMSSNPKSRWAYHRSNYNKVKTKSRLYNAFKGHGKENFGFEVLEDKLTFINAIQREMRLIALYNTTDERFGYNLTLGGIGTRGLFGPKNPAWGRKRPDNAERNTRIFAGERYVRGKPIRCNETGVEYLSIVTACRDLGLDRSCVSLHLAGRQKKVKGYTFSLVNKK